MLIQNLETCLAIIFVGGWIFAQEPKVARFPSSPLKTISEISRNSDVLPVDLFAWVGPLAHENKYVENWGTVPSQRIHEELAFESFCLFYEFCDMALNATVDDLRDCIRHVDSAPAREKALILSFLFIAVQTDRKPLSRSEYESHFNDLRHKMTWLEMMVATESFKIKSRDMTIDDNLRAQVKETIHKYINSEEIAFPAIETNSWSSRYYYDWARFSRSVFEKVDACEIDRVTYRDPNRIFFKQPPHDYLPEMYQQEYFKAILERNPDLSETFVRAEFAYATILQRHGRYASSAGPLVKNFSKKKKTVGDIAKQLLASWEEEDNDKK